MKKHTPSGKIIAMWTVGLLLFIQFSAQAYAKEKKRGSTLEIKTTEGKVIHAELLAVKEDRLLLMETYNYQELILPLDEIAHLKIVKSSKFFRGLGMGALSGILLGATLGMASGDDEGGWFAMSAGEKALLGGAAFGVLGLPIRGIAGAVAGIDESIQVSAYRDEEKVKLVQKLRSHARIPEYKGSPKLPSLYSTKPPIQNKAKEIQAPQPQKKFSRFHLTLGPRYFASNSHRGYRKLLTNSGFADTKPGGNAYFMGLDFGSYDAEDYPRQIQDQKLYIKDVRLEYSLSRSLMLGLGYAPLGSHSSHGYRYIPIDERTYSELYLTGEYTGSFYYISGAWMTVPDGFLQKTSLKLGAAAGVSSARMSFRLSEYAHSGTSTPGSFADFDKSSPAFMAFAEFNYFFNRNWSVGLNADYKYAPLSSPDSN